MVIASTFANATYERLPLEDEDEGSGPPMAHDPLMAGGVHGHGHGMPDPSAAMPMFNMPPNNGHLGGVGGGGGDGFPWAPHSRAPY